MPYRKVGWLKQIWYAISLSVKDRLDNFRKLPAIKEIYIDGKKNTEWKYNRFTGELAFKHPIPKGAMMLVVANQKKPRKRGKDDDRTGTEQTVLHKKAD